MSPQAGVRLLIGLLVLAAVLYCVWLVVSMIPLPDPLRTIMLIIVALIALGVLLNWTGFWGGPPVP